MRLALAEYREKLSGCWNGKNIGGTLGAPFECRRGVFDCEFYTQELNGEPLPNDDLDLQLVWLNAAEKHGRGINARILGEYWLSYIVPNWGEYGAGKNNMRLGLAPPLSGCVNNAFRDSNGAFIRSEIWACLAPGHPEVAVRYAHEDAIVDHSGEGVYAEVFFAAIESAAFVENDRDTLIDIGLSYIPADSGIATGVRSVRASYAEGLSWQEARSRLLNDVPGSFGILGMRREELPDDVPVGPMGYDAPSNAGIAILGWLYGEGDFGKSICIANNCGEGIPAKWKEPIGDGIKTLCLNLGDQGLRVPKTVTELTDRILRLTPLFLGSDLVDCVSSKEGYAIDMLEGRALFQQPQRVNAWFDRRFDDKLAQSPFTVDYDFNIISVEIGYGEAPYVQEGEAKTFTLTIRNQLFMQQWVNVKWRSG